MLKSYFESKVTWNANTSSITTLWKLGERSKLTLLFFFCHIVFPVNHPVARSQPLGLGAIDAKCCRFPCSNEGGNYNSHPPTQKHTCPPETESGLQGVKAGLTHQSEISCVFLFLCVREQCKFYSRGVKYAVRPLSLYRHINGCNTKSKINICSYYYIAKYDSVVLL